MSGSFYVIFISQVFAVFPSLAHVFTLATLVLWKAVTPFTPVVGVISTVLLVGASVAKCAEPIKGAGLPLQMACCALHLFGGTKILGSEG